MLIYILSRIADARKQFLQSKGSVRVIQPCAIHKAGFNQANNLVAKETRRTLHSFLESRGDFQKLGQYGQLIVCIEGLSIEEMTLLKQISKTGILDTQENRNRHSRA